MAGRLHPKTPFAHRGKPFDLEWQVLVIDDDPRVAAMLASQLKRAGMRVQVVIDGAAAPAVLLGAAEFDLSTAT